MCWCCTPNWLLSSGAGFEGVSWVPAGGYLSALEPITAAELQGLPWGQWGLPSGLSHEVQNAPRSPGRRPDPLRRRLGLPVLHLPRLHPGAAGRRGDRHTRYCSGVTCSGLCNTVVVRNQCTKYCRLNILINFSHRFTASVVSIWIGEKWFVAVLHVILPNWVVGIGRSLYLYPLWEYYVVSIWNIIKYFLHSKDKDQFDLNI